MRIHFHLFQDVYDWAGQLRTIDVRKNVPGAEFFLPVGFIELAASNCFRELAEAASSASPVRSSSSNSPITTRRSTTFTPSGRETDGCSASTGIASHRPLDGNSTGAPSTARKNHLAARAGSDRQDLGPLIRMFDKVVTASDAQARADWSADEIKRLAIRPYET